MPKAAAFVKVLAPQGPLLSRQAPAPATRSPMAWRPPRAPHSSCRLRPALLTAAPRSSQPPRAPHSRPARLWALSLRSRGSLCHQRGPAHGCEDDAGGGPERTPPKLDRLGRAALGLQVSTAVCSPPSSAVLRVAHAQARLRRRRRCGTPMPAAALAQRLAAAAGRRQRAPPKAQSPAAAQCRQHFLLAAAQRASPSTRAAARQLDRESAASTGFSQQHATRSTPPS